MTEAIYRKYRPQKFADVTDQNHVKITLQNQINTDSIAHAYLFSGPRGVGKTTIARLLAKAVNCLEQSGGEPCGQCDHCRFMDENRALDVIEMDAASHTGVDNVRENIIEAVRVTPGQGKYKVFIIDEVHMLSTSAFNALLKTLEEPPAHVIFILATTEVHKIPATILSRCQRFDFHKIATADMVERLDRLAKAEKVKVAPEVLGAIARLSEGCLRDAETLLSQILALGEEKVGLDEASLVLPVTNTKTVVEIVEALARRDQKSAIETLNNFVDQGGSIKNLTDELIDFVRTMMLFGLGGPYHDHYDAETMSRIKKMIELLSVTQCKDLLDALLDARMKPCQDSLPQIPLEIVIVSFCSAQPERKSESSSDKPEPPSGSALSGSDAVPPPRKEEKTASQEINQKSGGQKEASAASFSVEELQDKWQRCCSELAKRNIALPLVLQTAKPLKVEQSKVEIGFDKKFHFETISQQKNSQMLSDAISTVMGTEIAVVPIFLSEEEEQVLDTLVEAFGGGVVE